MSSGAGGQKEGRLYRICGNYLFPFLLLAYPLRHIARGLDLWDTGYNYANFLYWDPAHMGGMWFFSTYLANAVGHVLSLLPGGKTLIGLNAYTGLFTGALALIAYRFVTKKIQLPPITAFIGEFVAVSLCWCPTALLYNYVTYLLMLVCVVLLYGGLTEERGAFLVLAGAALGVNVFVRFSNLPQMGFILAVWAYGILCGKKLRKVAGETGLCMLGYFGAAAVFLGVLFIRYGAADYLEAIRRLFAMTDAAADYRATSMVKSILKEYLGSVYWIVRILFFGVAGTAACLLIPKGRVWAKRAAGIVSAAAMLGWLYTRSGPGSFVSPGFDSYDAMLKPAILFIVLSLAVGAIRILTPEVKKEEKLYAGLMILVLLITPIGSNNRLFPAINNLFLAVPYVFYAGGLFWNCTVRAEGKGRLWEWLCRRGAIPAAGLVLAACLLLFTVQSVGFGTQFVFNEARGAERGRAVVENNPVLKGVRMSAERAEWLGGISDYVRQNRLAGREVILYGDIPALSFYLQMPAAFSAWGDLASYNTAVLEEALAALSYKIERGAACPVVILSAQVQTDDKLVMIYAFMEQYGYTITYENSRFVLYEAKERNSHDQI